MPERQEMHHEKTRAADVVVRTEATGALGDLGRSMRAVGQELLKMLGIYLLYFALACGITWPAVLDLSGAALGHPGNDIWNHLWGFWWVRDALLHHGELPLQTELINHPRGGALYFIDMANALVALPLQEVLGLVAAYNLVVMGELAFAAFGAFLLARHLTRSGQGAWLAGVIYGFSPHLLAQLYNGISETLNAGWLPLFLLCWLKLMGEGRLSWAVATGATGFLTLFTNWYYGLFGFLSVLLHAGYSLAQRSERARWLTLRTLKHLGVAGLTFSLGALPLMWAFSQTLNAPDAIVGRDPEFVYRTLIQHNMTDLLIFFHPGRFYSPDLKALYGEDLIIVGYLGYVTLLLALVPAVMRRAREKRFWLLLGGVFFLLALGPFLYVDGAYLELRGDWIPLPFLGFFHAFPLFSRISHAFRFVVGVSLALGILAAMGAKALLGQTARGPWGQLLVAGCTVAILTETLLFSPAVWPIPVSHIQIPSFYTRLADEPDGFAVLDLPLGVPTLERAVYTFGQTVHHKKVPYGLNDPLPASLRDNRLIDYLLNLEFLPIHHLPLALPALELEVALRQLKAQNYRYVLVHEKHFVTQAQKDRVLRVLSALFGPPERYVEDGLSVYRVP